jgi:hypothetical protein
MAKSAPQTVGIYYRMDNPIDNIIDLGLVNYVQHPENSNYVVFRFSDPVRAENFEALLIEGAVWYEKGEEEKRSKKYVLFGIHQINYKQVQAINYLVEAKHKKPLIPGRIFRYSLLTFSASVLLLAILGYCNRATNSGRVNQINSTVSPH